MSSLLAPLETAARTATDVTPPPGEVASGQDAEPWQFGLQYALESPLARHKGSSVDPSWVGLSVNIIAVTKALNVLMGSDTLGRLGTVQNGDEEVTFRVDDDEHHVTVQELVLSDVVRAILAAAFTVPVVFDPYYAQSPGIQSYDAKEGWLNIYETHS